MTLQTSPEISTNASKKCYIRQQVTTPKVIDKMLQNRGLKLRIPPMSEVERKWEVTVTTGNQDCCCKLMPCCHKVLLKPVEEMGAKLNIILQDCQSKYQPADVQYNTLHSKTEC